MSVILIVAALAGCHMFEDISAINGPSNVEDTNLNTDSTINGSTDSSTNGNTDLATDGNTDSSTWHSTDSVTEGNTDSDTGETTGQTTDTNTESDTDGNTAPNTDGSTDTKTEVDTDQDTACVEGGSSSGAFCELSKQPCDCDNVCSEEFIGIHDAYFYYCHPKCNDGNCGYLGNDFACIDKPKLGIRPVCAAIGGMEPTEFGVPLFPGQVSPTSASTKMSPSVPGYPEIPELTNGFAISDVDITLVFVGLPVEDADSQYWRLEVIIPRTLYHPGTITADYYGVTGFTAHLYLVRTYIDVFESIAMAIEGGSLTLEATPEPCMDRNNCTERVTGSVQLDLVALQFAYPTP